MKKLLFLIVTILLFSCEKEGSDCWECSQYLLKRPDLPPHTIEYCGDFDGMRALEKRSGGLYTQYRCSFKP